MVFPACLQNIYSSLSKSHAITPYKKDMLFCLLLLLFLDSYVGHKIITRQSSRNSY